ncbi:hypothetical protein ABT063_02215 [Streptomyces sp. NPDC002838]|uniref:hypothetical protein n=1 Tax=Streptomyces sp. NPDC002838 TaxID=3154436 RepID=UPI00331B3135
MTGHRPGQWPADEPIDLDVVQHDYADDEVGLYLKRAAERGRREIVLGSIKAHLEEQPTANAVQSAARHWISDITAIGDEVAKAKRST